MRLASQIIAYGSAAAPSKFPKDDPIVLNVWAEVPHLDTTQRGTNGIGSSN